MVDEAGEESQQLRLPYVEVQLGSPFEFLSCVSMTLDLVSRTPQFTWELTSALAEPETGCVPPDSHYGMPLLYGDERVLEVPTVVYRPEDGEPVCSSMTLQWVGEGQGFAMTSVAAVSCPAL